MAITPDIYDVQRNSAICLHNKALLGRKVIFRVTGVSNGQQNGELYGALRCRAGV